MTAGTIFLMWIGEQIDEYGIGNGISLLIMAGILARVPVAIKGLWENSTSKLDPRARQVRDHHDPAPARAVHRGRGRRDRDHREPAADSHPVGQARARPAGLRRHPAVPALEGQPGRRHADHLRLQPADLPVVRLQQPGQASTPGLADGYAGRVGSFFAGLFQELADAFQRQSYIYTVCYIILIYFFCYFWTAITFNPKDMAENLKDYGSFIPGYRPGRRTADYLEKVMLRITYVGAAFLALVAVIPSLVQTSLSVDWTVASFLGGTGPPDRHQRVPRPGPEDRQPPGHAELHRPGERK